MNRLLQLLLLFSFGILHGGNPVSPYQPISGASVSQRADVLPPTISCPSNISYTLTPDRCDTIVNYTILANDDQPNFVVSQLSGLLSGGAFPIGATVNTFVVTDMDGSTASCSFSVTVNNLPHILTCKTTVTVGLDENCVAQPSGAQLLQNVQTGCPDAYLVQLDITLPFGNGPWIPANLTLADINKTYAFRVRDIYNGNPSGLCSGTLTIKDQQSPVIVCADITLPCEISFVTPDYLRDSLGITTAYPQISDACGLVTDTSFVSSLTFVDEFDPQTQILKYTRRIWSTTDDSGNKSSCEQYIYQVKSDLADVFFPADVTLECSDTLLTSPIATGQPYIVFAERIFPLNACAMVYTNVDSVELACGRSRQIFRRWYLLDSETAEERNDLQTIQINDLTPPQVPCPSQLTVTVEASACRGAVPLPDAVIRDGCSYIASFEAQWMEANMLHSAAGTLEGFSGNDLTDRDTLGVLGTVMNFPVGTTAVTYLASDACGNTASCQWLLTVLDQVPPAALCTPLKTVVLGPDGIAHVSAESVDAGSADACLPITFKIKLATASACDTLSVFDDEVLLCCADQGDTLAAILRVFDIEVPVGTVQNFYGEGHYTDCTAHIIVTDTLPPLCDNLPDITVNCSEFDPTFVLYGRFPASCAVDTSYIDLDFSLFDTLCKVGFITRTFTIVNPQGQSAYCLQHISVDPGGNAYYVRFPDDITVSTCIAGQNFGAPAVLSLPGSCTAVEITHDDVVDNAVPNACYGIERTWYVRNACHYNPVLPLVTVPNPQVAAGPTISAPGTTGIWAPTPPLENLWSENANGYQYKQLIRVVDVVEPIFENCPTEALTVQDSSNNDAQIWNESYWEDPVLQSNNLCEAAVDLSIQASDACNGGDLDFQYLLFLDLDGDNIEETVVNSNNLPGYNAIRYNNFNSPDYTGGTLRQFDERQVSASQKWGFSLQVIRTDTVARASVRFNTLMSPQGYINPQLPHGQHRIQWIVTDRCGNQTTCSSTFVIRDGKPPSLNCPSDVTVYFDENPGITELPITDLLLGKTDNCTPVNQIKSAMRLQGDGSGFPANQVQVLYFQCVPDAGKTKVVEVWVKDAAENSNFCEVDVHVDSCNLDIPPVPDHIVGTVTTENGAGINTVTMLVYLKQGSNSLTLSDTTDTDGTYDIFVEPTTIGPVFTGGTATIYPYKNTDPLNGVTTFDLLQISRHILGLDTLDSPYKIIAADANKSGIVTSFDVVELRKLILGLYANLPDNVNWRFIRSDYVFPDPLNPLQSVFPESDTAFYFLNGGSFSFIGLKVGDVNMSVNPQNVDTDIPERREQMLTFQTKQQHVEAGETFTATFSNVQTTEGFQFTLGYKDMELLEILPEKGMSADQFAPFPERNMLTIACENSGMATFSLRFKATRSGDLWDMLDINSQITPAAAWLPAGGKQVVPADVSLYFTGAEGFALLQNQPNPFTDKTAVRFHLPRAMEATLRIFDSNGRTVFTHSDQYSAGMHAVNVDLSDTPAGVLYYQLETVEYRAVQKMIRIRLR